MSALKDSHQSQAGLYFRGLLSLAAPAYARRMEEPDFLDDMIERSFRELYGDAWREALEAARQRILADDDPYEDGCC